MEKSFLYWKADLITEIDPFGTGLDRFVKLDKSAFIGRDALLRRQVEGLRKKLGALQIHASRQPANPEASLMQGEQVVGTITSGDWGHRTGLNSAHGFVQPDLDDIGTEMELNSCGHRVRATVIPPSPYDPGFERMRA